MHGAREAPLCNRPSKAASEIHARPIRVQVVGRWRKGGGDAYGAAGGSVRQLPGPQHAIRHHQCGPDAHTSRGAALRYWCWPPERSAACAATSRIVSAPAGNQGASWSAQCERWFWVRGFADVRCRLRSATVDVVGRRGEPRGAPCSNPLESRSRRWASRRPAASAAVAGPARDRCAGEVAMAATSNT